MGQGVDLTVLDRDRQRVKIRRSIQNFIWLRCDLSLRVADWENSFKNGLGQQLVARRGLRFGEPVLEGIVCPKSLEGDDSGFIGGQLAVHDCAGAAARSQFRALEHRFPFFAVQIFQQKCGPGERISVRILLGDGNRTRAAGILAGDLHAVVGLGNAPRSGVFLIQNIAVGRFRLSPSVGDTIDQIFKCYFAIFPGGKGGFGAVRAGQCELRACQRLRRIPVHLQNCELARPDVVIDGIQRDRCTILGNRGLINRFVRLITLPAGFLLDAVGSVGQVFGGSAAVLADRDDVLFSILRRIIAPGGFQPHIKLRACLRLLLPGNRVPGELLQLELTLDSGVRHGQGNAVIRVRIVTVGRFQLIDRLIQRVAGWCFRLLQSVDSIGIRAGERVRGKAAVLDGIGGDRLAGLIQCILRTVQRGIALGCAGFGVHLHHLGRPEFPGVLHCYFNRIIAGNRDGLGFRQQILLTGAYFLQCVGSNLHIIKIRLSIAPCGGGQVYEVALITGAIEPKRKALHGLLNHQTARLRGIVPGEPDVGRHFVRAAAGEDGLVVRILPNSRVAGGHELLVGGTGDDLILDT